MPSKESPSLFGWRFQKRNRLASNGISHRKKNTYISTIVISYDYKSVVKKNYCICNPLRHRCKAERGPSWGICGCGKGERERGREGRGTCKHGREGRGRSEPGR